MAERLPPWDSRSQRDIERFTDWTIRQLIELDLYRQELPLELLSPVRPTPVTAAEAVKRAKRGDLAMLRQMLPGAKITLVRRSGQRLPEHPVRRHGRTAPLSDAVNTVFDIYTVWQIAYGRKVRATQPSAFEVASAYHKLLGDDIPAEQIERAWRDRGQNVRPRSRPGA